jgi:hypothetical protein
VNRPQESHCDLGLIENDNTPDMRKTPEVGASEVRSTTPTTGAKVNTKTIYPAADRLRVEPGNDPYPALRDGEFRRSPDGFANGTPRDHEHVTAYRYGPAAFTAGLTWIERRDDRNAIRVWREVDHFTGSEAFMIDDIALGRGDALNLVRSLMLALADPADRIEIARAEVRK